MKLGLKIILPILLLLLIILGSFGYLLYNLKQQETVISEQGVRIQKLNSLNERLARQQDQTDYNVLAYRFNQDRAFILAISQAELDKSKTLDEMSPFITTTRGRELVTIYIDSRKEVDSLRSDLITAINEGNKEQINQSYNKWSVQTQNIKAAFADIKAYNINSLEKTLGLVEAIGNRITQIIIILTIVIIATVFFLYIFLRAVITQPIIKLAQFADEISRQNFTTTTTTTGINSNDEIGMLVRSFNTMSTKLKEYYAELEQKVRIRTTELANKVKTLEDTKYATMNLLEDIQEEKNKTEKVNAKDQAMLESIGDGLIVTDSAGKLVLMNKVAENLLGWKASEVLGKSVSKMIPLENEKGNSILVQDRPIQVALVSHKITTTTTTTTLYYVRKDKTKFPVAITARPIILNNETIGAIEVFHDITYETAVDKAKSEFVSLASHQLRTPLGIIKWYLEAWKNEDYFKKSPAIIKGYFDEVYKSNERVLSLVRDLLSVSRIEQGRVKNEPKSVDLIQTVSEIVEQMQIVARKRQVALHLTIEDGKIPSISIDILRFHEVIENLIANALEYTKTGGRVDVSLNTKDNNLLIQIKDTGIGISTGDQRQIFTKFFRSPEAVSSNPEGSGLGLYVVKSYVEGWGGKVSVESTMGKGSTFTISLPISEKKDIVERG